MAREYRYVSGDTHVEIDSRYWVDRVPAKYRDRAPRLVRLSSGGDAWLVEGRPLREVPADLFAGKSRETYLPYGQTYEGTRGTGPATQRIEEQDADGMDAEVLFLGVSGPGLWRSIQDDDAYRSVVRAYNDFLAEDYCAVAPDRLIGLGAIPWTGVDDALAEMEHCMKKGLKGIVLDKFPNGKGYPTPEDDKFWAAALDMHVPITVHQDMVRGSDEPLLLYPSASKEVLRRVYMAFADQVSKFARTGGVNAVQFVLDGVFDRFPDLRIFFAETQIGWIPFFYEQADVRFQRHQFWAERVLGWKPIHGLPSEYMREHCYWGFQYDRVGVEMRHHLGVDRLIWATDFPHQETEWPHSLNVIERNFKGVPADEVRKMTAQNAIDFFHLDQPQSARETQRQAVAG